MEELTHKIQTIQKLTGDNVKHKPFQTEPDSFEHFRKLFFQQVPSIHKKIQERNRLRDGLDRVRLSVEIRSSISKATETIESIKSILTKESKPIDSKIQQDREHYIAHAELQLNELEKQEKNIDYVPSIGFELYPPIASLPDIDEEGFQLLKSNDTKLDQSLDKASHALRALKEIALDQGKQIDYQTVYVQDMEQKVEEVQTTIENRNRRLKNLVQKTLPCWKLVIDIICLILLVSLGFFIYNAVRS